MTQGKVEKTFNPFCNAGPTVAGPTFSIAAVDKVDTTSNNKVVNTKSATDTNEPEKKEPSLGMQHNPNEEIF